MSDDHDVPPGFDVPAAAPATDDASPTPPDVPWLAGGQRKAIVANLDRAFSAIRDDRAQQAGAVAQIAQVQATLALVDQLDRLARILQVRP